MTRWPLLWCGFVRVLLVAMLGVPTLPFAALPAAADQSAQDTYSYVSPNFGYSIAWPFPWYISSESVDSGYDTLKLSDDLSTVQFWGARRESVTTEQAAQEVFDEYRQDPTITNVEKLDAVSCPFQTSGAAICFRYDGTMSDGTPAGVTGLIEAQTLGNGIMLVMVAGVLEPHLTEYLPKWASIEVAAPGVPAPVIAGNGDWEVMSYGDATFRIQPGVSVVDRDLAVEGIEYARRTVAAMAGPLRDPRLTVSVLTTASPVDPTQYGFARNSAIWIYTGSESWPEISPIERVQGLVHEYFHLFQFDQLDPVDASVPAWFLEGSADAFGYLAVSEFGVTDQIDFIRLSLFWLGQRPVSGALCDYVVYNLAFTPEVYYLSYLAVQELLARNGESIDSLVQVFLQMGSGATFETAFAETFHTDLTDFCAGEPGWRATLARVDTPPPDLVVYQGIDQVSPVRVAIIPIEAHPGEQILLTASTDPGSNCQMRATFRGGARQVTEETFANGSGEAFWLLIVPDGTLPGAAMVSIDCGANVVQQHFSVG